MKKQIIFLKQTILTLLLFGLITSCGSDDALNNFTVSDEINLGKILRGDIENDTINYPLLRRAAYPTVFPRLDTLIQHILDSELLVFKERFDWDIEIINTNTIQAFTLPGGYLYISTGMLKALETEDQLAALLAYEMAQTDLRIVTTNLIEKYSQTLLVELANNQEQTIQTEVLNSIASDLTELGILDVEINQIEFLATDYLVQTNTTSCEGLASLFEVLSQNITTEISWTKINTDLNTRTARVQSYAQSLSCDTSPSSNDYSEIKNALP